MLSREAINRLIKTLSIPNKNCNATSEVGAADLWIGRYELAQPLNISKLTLAVFLKGVSRKLVLNLVTRGTNGVAPGFSHFHPRRGSTQEYLFMSRPIGSNTIAFITTKWFGFYLSLVIFFKIINADLF